MRAARARSWTSRLVTEVVIVPQGCCGALTHHMGREHEARASAARNIRAFADEMDRRGYRRRARLEPKGGGMTEDQVPSPFDKAQLGPIRLRNRFIKSATFEGRSPRRVPTDELIEFHRAMAAGGVVMTAGWRASPTRCTPRAPPCRRRSAMPAPCRTRPAPTSGC